MQETILTCNSPSFLRRLSLSLAVLVACLLPLFVLTPLALYLGNQDEFSQGILSTLKILFLPICALLMLLGALLLCLPWSISQKVLSFLTALAVLIYIQGNWLLWDYGQLDGSTVKWENYGGRGLIDLSVWLVLVVLSLIYARQLVKLSFPISFVVLFLPALSIGLQAFDRPVRWFSAALPEERMELFRFSAERNVVVVLLDGFASPAFREILSQDATLNQKLEGFTYFRNTLGSFPTTSPSVPAILSGVAYGNDEPMKTFLSRVMHEHSLPSTLKKSGFKVHLATIPHYCDALESTSCGPPPFYTAVNLARVQKKELGVLLDTSLFRHSPHVLKRLVNNNENWIFQSLMNSRRGPRTQADSLDLVDLFKTQSSVADSTPRFKFVHLMVPHYPLRLTSDCRFTDKTLDATPENYIEQARCALKLALSICDRLRELQIYQQSTIVITADHGVRLPFDLGTSRDVTGTASLALPLLLIKPAEASGLLKISEVPAQLLDLPKTIGTELGLQTDFPGTDIFTLAADTVRSRLFRLYTWDNQYWLRTHLPPMQEYEVLGHAWDASAWKVGRQLIAQEESNQ